ncbi:restriction endonuclease subunit S, partial [Acidimicrobiia bacterium]|nr:restriction endonuclease subunit S [Acidimicrobiia bacterium]
MKLNTLDEVCEFQSGLWTGKKGPYIDVKVLRNTNFTKDNKLNLANIAEIKVEVKQLEKRVLKEGDILIEKSGGGPNQPVGRVVFIDKRAVDYSFSNFTSRIRVTSGTLNPNYLYWFLNYIYLSGKTENLQRRSTGIRNLQLKDYKQLAVPVPPLQEQEKIVERLDKIFTRTDNYKSEIDKTINNSRKLFESILDKEFSPLNQEDSQLKKLSDLSEIKGGKRVPKGY